MKEEENIFCGLSYWTWFAIIAALFLILLSSCATRKTQSKIDDLERRVEALHTYVVAQTNQSIDTSKRINSNIVTETIEFFNPSEVIDYDKFIAQMQAEDVFYSNIGLIKIITRWIDKSSITQSGIINSQSEITTDSLKYVASKIVTKEQTKIEEISFWQKNKWYLLGFCAILLVIGSFFIIKMFRFKNIIKL